jgi:hypothetical protein
MRKIINSTYISLDGVVEQPHTRTPRFVISLFGADDDHSHEGHQAFASCFSQSCRWVSPISASGPGSRVRRPGVMPK